MVKAYLSLGSNLGNRSLYLAKAIKALKEKEDIRVRRISTLYETAPIGFLEQGNFLNMAIEIETSLSPLELLKFNQEIEVKLQREKKIIWGPRTIDIDIITYNNKIIESENLNIPHKEALNRLFVLIPLAEITNNDFSIKGYKIRQKIKEILDEAPLNNNPIWLSQETLPF